MRNLKDIPIDTANLAGLRAAKHTVGRMGSNEQKQLWKVLDLLYSYDIELRKRRMSGAEPFLTIITEIYDKHVLLIGALSPGQTAGAESLLLIAKLHANKPPERKIEEKYLNKLKLILNT